MKNFELKNKIKVAYRQNKNTPRIAMSLNIAINKPEKMAGIYSIMNRLLLQGTKTRSAEQLANELDANAIEVSCDMKQDYLRFRVVCLNEDLDLALELLQDIVENSTFAEFEKEKVKLEGEIPAELDSARTRALDNFVKTLFKDHFYGNTFTKIEENLGKITQQDVANAYKEIMSEGRKVLSFVGDMDFNAIETLLNKHLGNLPNDESHECEIPTPHLEKPETIEFIKSDANQAQIFQGWQVPTITSEEYPAFVVLNTLLGASGLSSRLFCELRDKKGLAYTVRSAYEIYKKCANFNIYIATEPKNIQTSLDGFKEEIQKIKDVLVSEEELTNAKNNYIGKLQFITETNAQQANQMAHHAILGMGFGFKDELIKKVKAVTPEQVQAITKKYLNNTFVVSILRP